MKDKDGYTLAPEELLPQKKNRPGQGREKNLWGSKMSSLEECVCCGYKYRESLKSCPHCGEVNESWLDQRHLMHRKLFGKEK